MDPTANLKEQLQLSREALAIQDACGDEGTYTDWQAERLEWIACQLAELVLSLDEWITKGGFYPEAWNRKKNDRDVDGGIQF